MPEARLERTRDPQPTVPPCVRLGHAFQYHAGRQLYICLRCHLTYEHWNVIEGEEHDADDHLGAVDSE